MALLLLGGTVQADASLFDPSYRVIYPASRAKILLSRPSCAPLPEGLLHTVSGTWTPNDRDVDAMEIRLPDALKAAVGKIPGIGPATTAALRSPESISNHARQYAGLAIGGRKRILVIAAPIRYVGANGPYTEFQVQNSAWRSTRPLGACGGGPNQFSAQYDPMTGDFWDFRFSGTDAGKDAR
jgi:hypothetical protein